ncbi:peptide-methionine (S)-S-oxide reductase MsrA [Aeromonas schubertii]|uniref:peptide-methionine (S)-S-oxide reductase MsrA n=1 Tax=Aeromonas TaxID=642 RepID=UPI00067F2886|nr:peptide-methionine (S)-S-oxide reductase MsrA [Aeromonas schubertii]KUE81553.1 methionine sulfoxide reductase A [Aeromonas schubertii]MBZ6071782.1 peptide-methionine (S)-S-oxide reductase MsrA [Aeromonas schubertii]
MENISLVSPADALPGRSEPLAVNPVHVVNGHATVGPWPDGMAVAWFGMGCFWGVERLFWQQEGVWSTAAGYQGGMTPNPTYREVCSGLTGHAETVQVVFDPTRIRYGDLLRLFWEHHDPAQGMRQGGDVGTQYRSVIFWADEAQRAEAEASLAVYQGAMAQSGDGRTITTAILPLVPFYYAEEYHQQYLAKNPEGYCGLGGIGVCLPVGAN